ncbi:MAG TPA: TIGR01777 family oxidoreductase [Bryobacteraceae bacterium]|nr:TIGR01777 family oxidoreductase [Bryobacteraceae bacterium]
MNITLTGAKGFLGSHLASTLLSKGASLHFLGRHVPADLPAGVRFSEWSSASAEPPAAAFNGADVIINLAGEPVAQRWTPEVKKLIRSSRIDSTRQIVNALSIQSRRPQVLVNASAVGIYGSRGDEFLDEQSEPGGDFLARVVIDWEQAALLAESLGIRVVLIRTGLVLGRDGGVLARMLPPFRAGVGGRLGSGKQWMPWIHLDDWINLVLFAIENTTLRGAINATAPNPATNAQFTRDLAATVHRPAILPVPSFVLKMAMGEMAGAILASQRAIPKVALSTGFQFQFSRLRRALESLFSESGEIATARSA